MGASLWLDPDKPLMRGPQTGQLDAFCFAFNKAKGTAVLDDSIRGMLRELTPRTRGV